MTPLGWAPPPDGNRSYSLARDRGAVRLMLQGAREGIRVPQALRLAGRSRNPAERAVATAVPQNLRLAFKSVEKPDARHSSLVIRHSSFFEPESTAV